MVEKLVAAIRGLIRIAERSKTTPGCPGPGRARRGSGHKGYLARSQIFIWTNGRSGSRSLGKCSEEPETSTGPSFHSEILDEHDGVVGFVEDEFIHELL